MGGGGGGGPCDYCVSPSPKNWVFGFFRLRVRIWGLLGQGIGDLDSGLTISSIVLTVSLSLNIDLVGVDSAAPCPGNLCSV